MKLDAMRAKAGMTQNEVAKAAGISRASYCNIEIGRRRPSVPVAKRIAKVLDFNWTLFFDDGIPEEDAK